MVQMFVKMSDVLIYSPYWGLIPAFVCGVLGWKGTKLLPLVSAGLWVLYTIYETLNLMRITCSGECNIRIDLFVIYPSLSLLTLFTLIFSIKNKYFGQKKNPL